MKRNRRIFAPTGGVDFVQAIIKTSRHWIVISPCLSHVPLTWGEENQLILSSEIDGSIGAIKWWNAIGFCSIVAGTPAWIRYSFPWKSISEIEQQILNFSFHMVCEIFTNFPPFLKESYICTHLDKCLHLPSIEISSIEQLLGLKRSKTPKGQPSSTTL